MRHIPRLRESSTFFFANHLTVQALIGQAMMPENVINRTGAHRTVAHLTATGQTDTHQVDTHRIRLYPTKGESVGMARDCVYCNGVDH